MYGCELWSLTDNVTDVFCVARRRVLRRVLNLPYTAHCNFLPLLTDTLPAFDEICRRPAQFISSCLNSDSYLARTVARHGVEVARYNSCVDRNLLVCCDYFKWRLFDFHEGKVSLTYPCFRNCFMSKLLSSELNNNNNIRLVTRHMSID
jgi:hypothetical protein